MLFNSVEFALFLPIVLIIYWFLNRKSGRSQNILLLVASYFFYGWWDWRFLSLIIFSSVVDYVVGLELFKTQDNRKRNNLLLISVFTNIGFLCLFKYFNFFLDSFVEAFTFFGTPLAINRLNIVLPVGISFYTFQTLSYTIDIYKKKLEPTNDVVAFFAFVSFFPQLVAGPIERASHLLPQFFRKKTFHTQNVTTGLKLMAWGLFMKVAVADRLALYVDEVYGDVSSHSGISLIIATIFFAFQIYSDFAGYSLIAIGCAKLFDFDLMENFRRPYFSASFKTFWSRWHISLSTWFRDYVYIPLGGNRNGRLNANFNLFSTFVISGLWHGANWTFIVWGALHGVFQIIEKSTFKFNTPKIVSIIFIFILTCFAWIFFRAASLTDAFLIVTKISTFARGDIYFGDKGIFIFSVFGIVVLLLNDFIAEHQPKLKLMYHPNTYIRFTSILLLLVYITSLGVFDRSQFIYFQF